MPDYIAFLRAINVGGRNIKMAKLQALFRQLEFSGVETFIASGNVMFTSNEHDSQNLTEKIATHLQASLGYPVTTFLRSPAQLADIIAYQPFSRAEMDTASALNVALLAQPLDNQGQQALQGLETSIDRFHNHAREVYWWCARKQSEAKFSNTVFEKQSRVQTTFAASIHCGDCHKSILSTAPDGGRSYPAPPELYLLSSLLQDSLTSQ